MKDDLRRFAERVRVAGGRVLVIGGAVRDRLLGLSVTDVDLEVYGLSPERVATLAGELGEVREVGKAFGVLEVRRDASTVHVALPRRESKVAPGHRGFSVDTDPTMLPEASARRRDFTINAIAEDPLTGETLDFFQGRADLERRVLRVVDPERFGDDPLRVLRAAVFVAQFALTVEAESDLVIRQTVPRLRELHPERVGDEWRKLLLRPHAPSRGLGLLMDWGVFAVLHPEFVKLPETKQNPRWHPEGDVWTHTLLSVDAAADVTRCHALADGDRWFVMLAVTCHDLGKVTTTIEEAGTWVSPGHDQAGVEPTRSFLAALSASQEMRTVVVPLVREHLAPLRFFNADVRGQPVRDGAIRQLARRLHPATIFLLTLVADADHRGRGSAREAGERLRCRAEALGILHGPPQPVLRGADLLALGLPPGPAFAGVLREAERLRDDRGLSREKILRRLRGATSIDEALERLRQIIA